jgi:prolipoprotein diacylglyceryltransferase
VQSKELKILLALSNAAIFQIAWHWFITTQTTVAQTLLRLYLHHNAHSRKGVADYFDLAIPAIVFGLVIGRVGWQGRFGSWCFTPW